MKKNGIAVEMIPAVIHEVYEDYSHADMKEYSPGDTNFDTYVEASEYFELLEKYRKAKRTIAKMKRREYRKMKDYNESAIKLKKWHEIMMADSKKLQGGNNDH